MTLVRVAIPVFRGKRRFYLDKGRPWSAIEHLILIALASRPQTAAQLAAEAKIPRRLIIEVVIRLMRAGWVELLQGAEGVKFGATARGRKAAELDELPNVSKRIARWMNFLVDRVTGTIYRGRELPFFEKHLLEERAERERFVWMEPRGIDAIDETHAVVATLFNDDEKFVAMEHAGDRLVERFALVSVRAGKVEGLPSRAPRELEKFILDAVGHAPSLPAGPQSPLYEPAPLPAPEDRRPPAPKEIAFTSRDLVVGMKEHRAALLAAIRHARQCIIIHSTFIRQDKFAAIQPMLLDAVRRGARVDILWGEDEAKTETTATRAVVAALRKQVAELGFDGMLRIHPFSTRSHAKIVIADEGSSDRYLAIMGSCNWLSSSFDNFEVSVHLRDPSIIADVIDQLAELSRGTDGHWTDLTITWPAWHRT